MSKHGLQEDRVYSCKFCNKSFKTRSKNDNHQRNKHADQELSVCAECGKTVENKHKLQLHMIHVHPTQKLDCEYCGKVSKTKSALRSHQFLRHQFRRNETLINDSSGQQKQNIQATKICQICDSQVLDLRLHCMREHVKKILKNEIVVYKCCFCEKSFGRWTTISHHLLLHTGKPTYICDICSVEYKEKKSLTIHLQVSHGVEPTKGRDADANQTCDRCGFKSNDKYKFFAHFLTHGIKIFKCNICDFATGYQASLKVHIGRIHGYQTNTDDLNIYGPVKEAENITNNENESTIEHEASDVDDTNSTDCKDSDIHQDQYQGETFAVENETPELCESLQNNLDNLTSTEIVTETSSNRDELSCPLCGKVMTTKTRLKFHKAYYHKNQVSIVEENSAQYERDEENREAAFVEANSDQHSTETDRELKDNVDQADTDVEDVGGKHENMIDDSSEPVDVDLVDSNHNETVLKIENTPEEDTAEHLENEEEGRMKNIFENENFGQEKILSIATDDSNILQDDPSAKEQNQVDENKFEVNHHKKVVHKRKSSNCDECGERFTSGKRLQEHIQSLHTKGTYNEQDKNQENNFCDTCEKTVTHPASHHFYKHRVMPSPCCMCGKIIRETR